MSKNIVLAVFGGIVLIVLLFVGIMYTNFNNKDVSLRNYAVAQQDENKVVYDEVWKVLQQKAGIASEASGQFKQFYTAIFDERYQGQNSGSSPAFLWIKEQNPNFTIDMYKDLSTAVEVYRGKFTRVQRKLISIKKEHQDLRTKLPSAWFVGNRPELDIQIVTSTKTDKTFDTGKEDDVNLFK